MHDFLDLKGASGTAYRFRAWPQVGGPPPMAGNYALIAAAEAGPRVVALGLSLNLADPATLPVKSGARLFMRLNVSRQIREQEHQDLVQAYPAAAPLEAG